MEATNVAGGLALRGVLAIIFGVAAVFWPGITLLTLVYLFSAYVLINGIVDLVVGVTNLFSSGTAILTRILTVVFGGLQVAVGVYLLRHVTLSFATLILLIGFLLIVRGLFEIMQALFEEGSNGYRVVMIIVGILAVLAGIVMLFQPVASGVAFVWILGIYGLITGPLLIAGATEVNRTERLTINTVKR